MAFFTQSESLVVPDGAERFLSSVGMEVLGQNFYLVYCQFNPEGFKPELHQYLRVAAEPGLNQAVLKRQSEFLAGRYVARLALEYLNIRSFELGIGQHRQPLWPAGVAGSISHTNTLALCVVSPSLCYLGIDSELQLAPEQARAISTSIATMGEYQKITEKGMEFSLAVSLLFSAKESLFKAIFPRVGRYLDFSTSTLVNVDTEKRRLRLRLQQDLQEGTGFYHDFDCHYLVGSADVLTLVYGPD